MTSIHDIWEDEVEPRSPAPARPRQPLFFEEDEDGNNSMSDAPPRREPDVDVDQLFDGAMDDVRDGDPADSGKAPLSPHQVLSSSPAHHLNDAKGEGGAKDGVTKPKKKTMRLDEGRLIGDSGFPQLIADTKEFKVKGKGHEASDLNRLLQVYQFWTHRLYPKTPFKDTVDRVEKLCHSKRMHNQLSTWRDEAHGVFPGEQPEEEEEGDSGAQTQAGAESDHAEYASSSSHAATVPPSSPNPDASSDFDTNAMDAAARKNAHQSQSHSAPRASASDTATLDDEDIYWAEEKGDNDNGNEDDWGALDQVELQQNLVVPPAPPPRQDDEDEWAAMDEFEQTLPPAPPTAPPTRQEDEDEWDAVDSLPPAQDAMIPPKPKPVDEDDMYIDGSA
ncbi:Swi3-domain-containing protein [Roridomyces roridus]|uniref:Chromosome segregation in meiosis protein n=1 Tax=Roridomyces roridus TaxID=1738132 RepID=A0AAD7FMF0_9AGAR|nr:Swi3-domain-containing protein [Roridomyces roridus]